MAKGIVGKFIDSLKTASNEDLQARRTGVQGAIMLERNSMRSAALRTRLNAINAELNKRKEA